MSRGEKMAKNLIHHSVDLQKGENLLIEVFDGCYDLAEAVIAEAQAAGGNAYLSIKSNAMLRSLLMNCTAEQLKKTAEYESHRMDMMDAYIAIRGADNNFELSDVPAEKMNMYQTLYMKPVHTLRRMVNTKWCVMGYPSPSFAQKAGMSTEAFTDFYFDVCGLDYDRMGKAMDRLVDYMNKTDKVRIVSSGTDISFSIKDYPAVKCYGRRNMPDGEVYAAPVPGTANGYITYNVPCDYLGFVFENVRFEFKDGIIIDASGNNREKIMAVLNTDEGARRLGEFALGVNPCIIKPIVNTLFDEKMSGSLHLTPGNAYAASNNGNKSAVHWDMVQMHTPEYGGGEVWFDGIIVRKDGRFTVDELKCLNPENLI